MKRRHGQHTPQPCRTARPGALQTSDPAGRWTPAPPARHPGGARRGHGDAGSTLAKPPGRGVPARQPPARATTPEACFVATSRHQDPRTFQRLQALEDAICYRTARLAEPCGACGPADETRCDEHACDLSLIAAYQRSFKDLAGSMTAARERARAAHRKPLCTSPR